MESGIGVGLRSRIDAPRTTDVEVAVHVLNRMLALARRNYVRIGLTPNKDRGRCVRHSDPCTTLAQEVGGDD